MNSKAEFDAVSALAEAVAAQRLADESQARATRKIREAETAQALARRLSPEQIAMLNPHYEEDLAIFFYKGARVSLQRLDRSDSWSLIWTSTHNITFETIDNNISLARDLWPAILRGLSTLDKVLTPDKLG